ncbi:hypothetical protein K439DRAFT_1026124 [Ramaria rubella]|nr:hypothetical protein K439DRAFT_1026124 [Ramaria rubella]
MPVVTLVQKVLPSCPSPGPSLCNELIPSSRNPPPSPNIISQALRDMRKPIQIRLPRHVTHALGCPLPPTLPMSFASQPRSPHPSPRPSSAPATRHSRHATSSQAHPCRSAQAPSRTASTPAAAPASPSAPSPCPTSSTALRAPLRTTPAHG